MTEDHPLPRSYEALVRDCVKFRVGQIVYAAFSRDETIVGFAFPKEEREALVTSEPTSSSCPSHPTCGTHGSRSVSTPSTSTNCGSSVEAWRMVVRKNVAAAYEG
jgi:hypothetical protein